MLSSPHGAWAFYELRKYHTRPLRLNWGPKNVHFGKTFCLDQNFNARKELLVATFLCFAFFTAVPQNGQ